MIVCKKEKQSTSRGYKGKGFEDSDLQKNHYYCFNTFLFYLVNLWQTSEVGQTTTKAKLPLYPNSDKIVKSQ